MRALCICVVTASVAFAQPKSEPAPLLGAKETVHATPATGFIDDVATADADTFVYVVTDGVTQAALHVVTIATGVEMLVDLSTITLQPVALQLIGKRVLVVGNNDGKQVAALVELAGKKAGSPVYKVAAADHITPIVRDGKPRLAVHRMTTTGELTRHSVDIHAIENGQRVQAGKGLTLDSTGTDKKLDFRVNHWSDGWTKAYGIKAGEWDRKEDQKAPDQEATLDLVTGKLDKQKITDLFDQKKRFAALADAGSKLDFVRLANDGSALQLWRGGKMRVLELDQKLTDYEPKSLQALVASDGTGWLALKVDPVNAEAVARKRADPEYLDVFKITADGKATRKARILAKGIRHRFGTAGDRFWVIERNASMERGGKSITLYSTP
jgi:hypothetical protein